MKSRARAGSKRRWAWPPLVPGSKRLYGKARKCRSGRCSSRSLATPPRGEQDKRAIKEQLD